MNLVLADDIAAIEAASYVMTHTTNPLLSSVAIAGAIADYQAAVGEGRADSLFTVNKVQTRFYSGDGSAVNHDPGNLVRTQDMEPWYEETSNLSIFNRDSFARTSARSGTTTEKSR